MKKDIIRHFEDGKFYIVETNYTDLTRIYTKYVEKYTAELIFYDSLCIYNDGSFEITKRGLSMYNCDILNFKNINYLEYNKIIEEYRNLELLNKIL